MLRVKCPVASRTPRNSSPIPPPGWKEPRAGTARIKTKNGNVVTAHRPRAARPAHHVAEEVAGQAAKMPRG